MRTIAINGKTKYLPNVIPFPAPTKPFYKVSWFVGTKLNKWGDEIPELTRAANLSIAKYDLSEAFGGVSIFEATGSWLKDTNGFKYQVNEPSIEFVVVTEKIEKVRDFTLMLKRLFEQETVLEVVVKCETVSFV